MGTTPNYGWVFPDPGDFVKDLPADFELFADAVDADLGDLLGGTTGQYLSKASNSDHDFVWATVTAGGMTQIASGTLSGSAVNLTSIAGTYVNLLLIVRGMTTSTTSKAGRYRFNNDSGTKYREFNWAAAAPNMFTASNQTFNGTFGQFDYYGTGTARGLSVISIPDYKNTTSWKIAENINFQSNGTTNANIDIGHSKLYTNITAAITEINLFPESGTFTGGTYNLYGVA
jgi:hypothetical protein